MKKFISIEELPDILNDLAEKFIENCDKVAIKCEMYKYSAEEMPRFQVSIQNAANWEMMCEEEYYIITKVCDADDVLDDTVVDVLAKL